MPIDEVGHWLFLVFFWTMFAGCIWIPTTWWILTLLTPKALLNKYFKQPHFTSFEVNFYSHYPGSLMRTSIFAWMLFFPKLAHKKRKIFDIHPYMPSWYRYSLKTFLVLAMSCGGIFFTLMAILSVIPD